MPCGTRCSDAVVFDLSLMDVDAARRPRREACACKRLWLWLNPGLVLHMLSFRVSGYSITCVALPTVCGATVRPSTRAVRKFTTSSPFPRASIGSSPGLSPFRILVAWLAILWVASRKLVP